MDEAKVTLQQLQVLLEVGRTACVGTTFQERMAALVPLVQQLIPHTRASASVLEPEAPAQVTHEPAWFFGNSVGVVHPYAERYMKLDPMRPVYAEADGRPALLSDTEVGRRYGQDAFTAEFLAALGIRHVMLSVHRMPDGSVFAFALHRGPDQPDFSREERALMGLCAPDLARAACAAVLRRTLLAQVGAPGAPAGSVHGLAYDAEGRVVHDDLGASPLLVPATLERLGIEVREFLGGRPPPGTAADRVLQADGTAALPIRLVAMDRRSGVAALALLAHEVSDSRFERLVREARLTTRERQVAALAIEGLRNRDIADRLGVGVDTVKWHLKTIFQKTKVRGRGGLAAIVLGRA
ncbi:MAG: helix-turn-helix transcriptional regulator [Planctomycetes bacterium]|nr:helix-turn-helix transcriptional regulator [Planctomycetota bacterium]